MCILHRLPLENHYLSFVYVTCGFAHSSWAVCSVICAEEVGGGGAVASEGRKGTDCVCIYQRPYIRETMHSAQNCNAQSGHSLSLLLGGVLVNPMC